MHWVIGFLFLILAVTWIVGPLWVVGGWRLVMIAIALTGSGAAAWRFRAALSKLARAAAKAIAAIEKDMAEFSERRRDLQVVMRTAAPEQPSCAAAFFDNREAYIIGNDDYKRGNPKEHFYRKRFMLALLDVYGNRCGKCGRNDNGVDIDHFFMSKNEGGCFIMRLRDGMLVNNAVPLCQTCNRSKSDINYKEFYNQREIAELLVKNALLTAMLNEHPLLDSAGHVIKVGSPF